MFLMRMSVPRLIYIPPIVFEPLTLIYQEEREGVPLSEANGSWFGHKLIAYTSTFVGFVQLVLCFLSKAGKTLYFYNK